MIRAVAAILVTAWLGWLWHEYRQLVRRGDRDRTPSPWTEDDDW